MCDIEQMFHQFKVCPEHRDYLRFLWWNNEECEGQPIEYRMTVHLFGAASSPACANFGLKQVAIDNEAEFGLDVSDFVKSDFYVDDGLKSVTTVDEAVSLIERSKLMLKKGGLRLHKFLSNSKAVLQHISSADRAKALEKVDLPSDELPVERALGVKWCVESDSFLFDVVLSNKPQTRRGILSMLSSVYDPLGFLSPFILIGKQILQLACKDQFDWDCELPLALKVKWEQWCQNLECLKYLRISRCIKPDDFGEVIQAELHHFSDASTSGYGQCSYIRLVNSEKRVHCSLVMAKSRVVPLKPITIPRLELSAAVLSVKIGVMLRKELKFDNLQEFFWTDSNIVIGYISNDSRRFHVFVANRVQQIRDHTHPSQWNYVTSHENPADITSRGVNVDELIRDPKWFKGPKFLWDSEFVPSCNQEVNTDHCLSSDDPEVKRAQNFDTNGSLVGFSSILERLEYFSDWTKAKRAIAICLKLKEVLRKRATKEGLRNVTVEDMRTAEIEILRIAQENAFADDIHELRRTKNKNLDSDHKKPLKRTSSLYRLDPYVDTNGLLRVGGRLCRSNMKDSERHPIILPKKSHIALLVIRQCHEKVEHQGRGLTVNAIRDNGYWIVGCSNAVSKYIRECVSCRKYRGVTESQKMADLPEDRVKSVPPFTYSAVDFFGPWIVREGRKEVKRYGVLFTCLSCRAIHLETANSLDTSSFINALRRFIAVRGRIRQLRSDRGTNFVGAERELREALQEVDNEKVKRFLAKDGCDFVRFEMNVPSASHMGGVWERQNRSVRSVLASLMYHVGPQLDDESLRTFMCEAAAIVNGRPLTTNDLNDPMSLEPLTPNHLLTMKSEVVLPPPGEFQKEDVYSRKRWRRVQYALNEFWQRWKREYLQNLQVRNKWNSPSENLKVNDVVLVIDNDLPRNQWLLGRIQSAVPDDDGLVRKVSVVIGSSKLDRNGKRLSDLKVFERPIHKLILLYRFPVEEP